MESLQFSIIAFGISVITGNLSWIFSLRWLGITSAVVFILSLLVLVFYYKTIELLYDTELSWNGLLGFVVKIGAIYGFMVSMTNMGTFLSTANWWNFSLQLFWVAVAIFMTIATLLQFGKNKSMMRPNFL